MKIESGVRQGCCLSLIMFKLCSDCLNNETRKGFGGFKIKQIIPTVKCADDRMLLAKEEMVLQWNGNECGEKTKVKRISRQPSRVQSGMDQKQFENVEYCNKMMQNMKVKLNPGLLWRKQHSATGRFFFFI
jgi:hypothetical protein